ncbi:hypothetical protein Tco_1151041 [Tanacetum coccineum]
MSRDVITVGSTMRISLLYRGEYSQWRERFMNYLEEQTDGEAMINSIQNGDHPLPVVAQVSLAGTAPNAPPTLKDPQFWTAEEKKNRKIDRLARSLLIQGLPNDIYSLIDSNELLKIYGMLLKGRCVVLSRGVNEPSRAEIMTSITAQQTKLELELVPKGNRLDIGKCNRRIPLPSRDFDALPSEEDTISFLRDLSYNRVINSLNDVVIDQMHQPWRTFAALINRSKNVDYVELLWEDFTYQIDNKVYKKQEKMYYPRFTKVIIHHFLIQEKSLSWRNRIGMHTSKDDYLINTLRFVSRREASQKYRVVLPECLTSLEMKESKEYKTYLSYATGEVPPKVSRKFKKASLSKKESELVPGDEEPIKKGKRLKTPARNSTSKPATGIVIIEPPVETKSKRKEKEKVDVAHGKGIELLSEVALFEKAQMKEARMKSLRDFHKNHPSGSGTVAEKPLNVEKITPTGNNEDDNNNKQESSNESSKQDNESEEQELDSKQDEESDDDDQEQEDFDQENESEDDEMKSHANDAEMTEAQQGNKNLETTQEQVVEDAYVTISTLSKKTKVPVTSSSRSSDLASKFLNFSDIPQTDAEIVSPLDVHVHHEVPRTQTPTLLTIPVSVIYESSPVFTNIPQSSYSFTPTPIQATPTPLPTIKTTNPLSNLIDFSLLPQILPQEVSNFAPPVIEKLIKESRDEVTLAKVSSQPQSTYEAASTLIEFELKMILLDKMEKSKSYLTAPKHQDCYDGLKKSYALDKDCFYSYDVYSLKRGRKDKDKDKALSAGSDRGLKKRKTSKDAEPTTGSKKKDSTFSSSKGTKSQPKSTGKYVQSEEPVFEVADSDMPEDQAGNLGDNKDDPRVETASRRDWFKKSTPPQEPTDPDWNVGKTT